MTTKHSTTHPKFPRTWLGKLQWLGVAILLIGMPLHGALVVVLGSALGHPTVVAAWKEVIVCLIIAASTFTLLKHRHYNFFKQPLVILIAIFSLLGLLASIRSGILDLSFWMGLKTTVLPLLALVAVQPLAKYFSNRQLTVLLVGPAIVVSVIAIWQFLFVPTGFLVQLGYSAATINPVQNVHPGVPFLRSFSTLGGPNQLGVYLIIPIAISAAYAVKAAERTHRLLAALILTLTTAAAVSSFSRSALLGMVTTLVVGILLAAPKKLRPWLISGGVIGGGLGVVAIWTVLRDQAQSVLGRFLLRGEVTDAGVIGNDSGHLSALVLGWDTIKHYPFGLGFGTAGPASFYAAQPLITENWYLQIAIETGIIGLVCMLLILARIATEAIRHRPNNPLNIALAASLAGLAIANLFLHAFADSSVAIVFFLYAGLILGRKSVV